MRISDWSSDVCSSDLWLEDGLAKNTLEAYRRDLRLFATWLQGTRNKKLLHAQEEDLNAYFFARHEETKASSSNRRLAVLKRFYQLAIRQNKIAEDPCRRIRSAKQRSEEHTSELQSLMRISYAVFCLKKKKNKKSKEQNNQKQ